MTLDPPIQHATRHTVDETYCGFPYDTNVCIARDRFLIGMFSATIRGNTLAQSRYCQACWHLVSAEEQERVRAGEYSALMNVRKRDSDTDAES